MAHAHESGSAHLTLLPPIQRQQQKVKQQRENKNIEEQKRKEKKLRREMMPCSYRTRRRPFSTSPPGKLEKRTSQLKLAAMLFRHTLRIATIDTTSTSQSMNGRRMDTMDVITKGFTMSLGAAFSETFSSFASSRHVVSLRVSITIRLIGLHRWAGLGASFISMASNTCGTSQ